MTLRLYGYYRSSASYRVRIALHHKGIAYAHVAINLAQGDQHEPAYRSVNPQAVVPTLVTEEGRVLGQSLAILEFLEERYPAPALLPRDAAGRARVRSLALSVACDIHPLQNVAVRNHLLAECGFDAAAADRWNRHWIARGLATLERRLALEPETGSYCHGDSITFADLCLVPQLYNAERFGIDLATYPTSARIRDACERLPAFRAAHPHRQPDTPPSLRLPP
jgi:maleylpyruvate isomerase